MEHWLYYHFKSTLIILGALLYSYKAWAQSGYVGEDISLPGPVVSGTIGAAAWSSDDNNLVFVTGDTYGATASIQSYFSGKVRITCSYVYTYYVGSKKEYSSPQHLYYDITCKPSVVKLNKQEITLPVGQEIELSYTNSSGYDLPFIYWTTSDKKIANFEGSEKLFGEKKVTVTAVSSGQCIITAEGYTGYDAPTCIINVPYIAPTSITIKESNTSIIVGKTKTLSYKLTPDGASANVTWTSSNDNIAKISSTGKITAKAEGTVTITATTDNGLSSSTIINVVSVPTSVSLPNYIDVYQGYGTLLTPTLTPNGSGSTYKWTSKDKTIATVSTKGVVTGKNLGTTTITVTTENGLSADCQVTVKEAPTSADYRNAKIRIKVVKDLVEESFKHINK